VLDIVRCSAHSRAPRPVDGVPVIGVNHADESFIGRRSSSATAACSRASILIARSRLFAVNERCPTVDAVIIKAASAIQFCGSAMVKL
jgi:hypothetical protein